MSTANYRFMSREFNSDIEKIKSLFTNPNNPNYLLKNINYNENVPIECLETYFSQIWSKINTKKDLFLPSEKKLISFNFCQNLLKTKFYEFAAEAREIEKILSARFQSNFINKLDSLLARIQDSYKKEAWQYDKEIYQQTMKELEIKMKAKIQEISSNEIKKACIMAQRDFQRNAEELLRIRKGVNLYDDLSGVLEKIRKAVESRVKQCTYERIDREPINNIMDILNSLFKGIIAKTLEKFLLEQENMLLRILNFDFKSLVQNEIENKGVFTNFWQGVSNSLQTRVADFQTGVNKSINEDFKVKYFGMIEKMIRNVFVEFKENCKGYMKAKAEVYVLETLKNEIKAEEAKMDERIVDEAYRKALNKIDEMLNIFRIGKIEFTINKSEGGWLEINENILIFEEEREITERKKSISLELVHERELILNKIVKNLFFFYFKKKKIIILITERQKSTYKRKGQRGNRNNGMFIGYVLRCEDDFMEI